ncbi:MAG: beta-ketoacyl-ACP synthase I [Endozoicomonadaceae bacterium]|nr:beta-ketoacyl-ACP synthase I [Endozoicomonadaceae bacterium]MBE8233696.1 beta-ketoacyl-ACP synthase I [Endozoicomonadaceae bacterium]
MKRVVVTGMGILSCLGNDFETISHALKTGKSGITFQKSYQEYGLRSQVAGLVNIDLAEQIDRKILRFMSNASAYTYIAMRDAIEHSKLPPELVSHEMTGLVVGSGGASAGNILEAGDLLREFNIKRVGPYRVTRTMGSAISACLASPFKIKGINYSITSACATSAHCIGHAMEQIQLGKQNIMFAGGGDDEHWLQSALFDAMGALSSKYNDTPEMASRPYDRDRDGFAISSGGGILVLESLEHAKARGATIYGELVGYAATSDGHDMVAPSGEGAIRCMKRATANLSGSIDYINTHGTSTPVGDKVELASIKTVFGDHTPLISSTKSLSGHALGGAGVHEAIYCLLMMQQKFVSASFNIQTLSEDAADMPIVLETCYPKKLDRILSNSFGFGGTNACLVFQRFEDE